MERFILAPDKISDRKANSMKNENIPSNIRAAARLAAAVIKRMKQKRDACLISAADDKSHRECNKNQILPFSSLGKASEGNSSGEIH